MSTDIIQDLRTNPEIEFFEDLIQDVKGESNPIDIPDRDKLYTDKIELNSEPDGNIYVNGQYVHPVYARIVNQLSDGLSPIIVIVGREGLGKSMTGVRMAYELHNKINCLRGNFNVDNQVVYRVLEFLFLERSSTRKAELFEEANETLNSSDYHSPMNKAVAGATRTQRKRENPKIFICPEFKQLDSRIREKVDVMVDMKGKQFAEVTTYRLKHGKRGNRGLDYYYNGDYPYWRIPDVPKKLRNQYDKLDNAFKGDYLDELILEVLQKKMEDYEDQQTVKM